MTSNPLSHRGRLLNLPIVIDSMWVRMRNSKRPSCGYCLHPVLIEDSSPFSVLIVSHLNHSSWYLKKSPLILSEPASSLVEVSKSRLASKADCLTLRINDKCLLIEGKTHSETVREIIGAPKFSHID